MFPGILRSFHEVARANSIRKASEALGISASSVSRQVAILERQIGTRLIDRSANGITLTHPGKLVAAFAQNAVADFDSLKLDLNDLKGGPRRLIHIAAVESIISTGPIAAMAAMRKQINNVSFRLTLSPAPEVVTLVKKDLCDIGITMGPPPDPAIVTLARVAEPVVLLVRDDHPLASEPFVTLEHLSAIDLALPESTYGIRQMLDQAMLHRRLPLDPCFTANTFEGLREFVRLSGAAAVLPMRAARIYGDQDDWRAITIADETLKAGEMHIIARQGRRMPRIHRQFADLLILSITEGPSGSIGVGAT